MVLIRPCVRLITSAAIVFYRRASKIVPDIDLAYAKRHRKQAAAAAAAATTTAVSTTVPPAAAAQPAPGAADDGGIAPADHPLCGGAQAATHISALPAEVLAHLLGFLVGPDLVCPPHPRPLRAGLCPACGGGDGVPRLLLGVAQ